MSPWVLCSSFVSFLIFSNKLPTITATDFCLCHLGWLELLLRSIWSMTLKSVFNYVLLVSTPCAWAYWNWTPQTLNKATKLCCASAINNMKLHILQMPHSAMHRIIWQQIMFSTQRDQHKHFESYSVQCNKYDSKIAAVKLLWPTFMLAFWWPCPKEIREHTVQSLLSQAMHVKCVFKRDGV